MPKGKPWIKEEEQILIELLKKGKSVDVISRALGKPEGAVYMKMKRLGLEVVVTEKNQLTTTSSVKTGTELPSIENVMKRLSAALSALETPGIEKKEVIRLRCFIQGVKIYKELFADYVDYRGIETELVQLRGALAEMREAYERLAKKA